MNFTPVIDMYAPTSDFVEHGKVGDDFRCILGEDEIGDHVVYLVEEHLSLDKFQSAGSG